MSKKKTIAGKTARALTPDKMMQRHPVSWLLVDRSFAITLEASRDNVRQRGRIAAHVEKLARLQAEGDWELCTTPIVFSEEGLVIDGQHKIWSVIQSGIPQWFMFVKNVPVSAMRGMNQSVPWKPWEIARSLGESDLPKEAYAICSALVGLGSPVGTKTRSAAAQIKEVVKHESALVWTLENYHCTVSGLRRASVRGAIAAAWKNDETHLKRLKQFCEVLASGVASTPSEQRVVALRDTILSGEKIKAVLPDGREVVVCNNNGHAANQRIFKHVMAAIEAFI